MAEERLIDDDKDRKYKIRINENGEEELVISPQDGEEENAEEVSFEVPDFDTDDEEAAVMTPEQLAARQRQREEEEARRAKKVGVYVARAKACLDEEDYSGAIYALGEAGELDGANGEIYALKVKAYSKNFTDWSQLEACAEAADGLEEHGTEELKNGLKEISSARPAKIAETEKTVDALNEENEVKKAERREVFLKRKKTAFIAFGACAAPFAVFLVLAAVIGAEFMFTREDALFTVITAVFAVLALAAFIAMLVTAHRLWDASRNVKLNERNSSTKLGREYEDKNTQLKQLTRIYAVINNVSLTENVEENTLENTVTAEADEGAEE